MLGAAIAYNIKKWLNYKAPKVKIAVMALTKPEKGFWSYFFKRTTIQYHHNG
jgi:hypothetical protein